MAWVVDWTVRPFEGPEDREARRRRCVELAAEGGKSRAAIARELQVHSHFVWKALRTPEQRERHVAQQREHRREIADLHKETLRCVCGKERRLSRESIRKIRKGEMSGLCASCSGKRSAARRRGRPVDDAPLALLSRDEIREWARIELLFMEDEERVAIAALEPPEVPDDSRPARRAGVSANRRLAA